MVEVGSKIELIRSVDLKIARAKQQIDQLGKSIDDWVSKNPITMRCELRNQRLGFRIIQNEFTAPAPLDEWSLIVGEYAHNLRSALDNLAFALARLKQDPPAHPSTIAFPIYANRTQFENNAQKRLSQFPDESAKLIEMFQPFQRDGSAISGTPETDALIFLQWLNNSDKHRVPSVVLLAPTGLSHAFTVEFYTDEDAAANVPPDATIWGGPLHPGAVLIEHRTKNPIASVRGDFHGAAIVALQTEKQPIPISPNLAQIGYYTELVISYFRQYFC